MDDAGAEDLRVPRLRAARRALHQAGAPEGRGRHLRPVRAQEPAARAGAGDAGARDRDLREDRLRQPGDRGAQGIHRPLRPRRASSAASTPTAGTRRSRWSRPRLAELARHYHATAQKTKASADYAGSGALVPRVPGLVPERPGGGAEQLPARRAAVRGQRASPRPRVEYEKTAYGYPKHEKSADAGYGALLGYAALLKKAPAAEQPALQRATVASALRFAQTLPDRHARRLGAHRRRREALRAEGRRPGRPRSRSAWSTCKPPAADAQRRVAWTVIAYTSFDKNAFAVAEKAFAEVLKLTPEKDPARADLVERQAAAIYKQAEQARAGGQTPAKPRRASPASARWRRRLGGARQRAVRRGRGADRAQGLGRRDQDPRGLPPALPEPCAAARGQQEARGRLPREGPVGECRRRVRAPGRRQQGPEGRARRALAGGRAVREGRTPSRRRPRPTSATWRSIPAAARAGGRGALAPRPDRQGQRQRRARGGADARDLRRRPGRRRGAHRPHPLPRRDRGAGDGRAGGRVVSPGRAGRAAAAPAAS